MVRVRGRLSTRSAAAPVPAAPAEELTAGRPVTGDLSVRRISPACPDPNKPMPKSPLPVVRSVRSFGVVSVVLPCHVRGAHERAVGREEAG